MRHELWSDGRFFPVINRLARTAVAPGAVLVWTADAPDWHSAMQRYYEYRMWGPYRPLDTDPGRYTPEQEADARRHTGSGGP